MTGAGKNRQDLEEMMQTDWYKEFAAMHREKEKTLRTGSNVVHLDHYDFAVNKSDLEEISGFLKEAQLELSSFDKQGIPYASIEDFTNMMQIVLGDELTKNIVFGVVGNAVWDTIKTVTKKVFGKVEVANKKIKAKNSKVSEITFGIDFKLDKNTGFAFRLSSKYKSSEIDEQLDQMPVFIKNSLPNATPKRDMFLRYDSKKKCWVPVDMEKEFQKRIKEQNKKRKAAKRNNNN